MVEDCELFVSYSIKDERWLNKLQTYLKPRRLKIFQIAPGKALQEEMESIVSAVKVAVLLVTQNYFADDDIASIQLPLLLQSAKREEKALTLLSILVSPCDYKSSDITKYKLLNEEPLTKLSANKQKEIMVDICYQIEKTLNSLNDINEERIGKIDALKHLAEIIADLKIPVEILKKFYDSHLTNRMKRDQGHNFAVSKGNVPEILNKLDKDMHPSPYDNFPPLLYFVLQLAQHNNKYQVKLEKWVETNAQYWYIKNKRVEDKDIRAMKAQIDKESEQSIAAQEATYIPSLLIELECDGLTREKKVSEIQFKIKDIWLHKGLPGDKAKAVSLWKKSYDFKETLYTCNTVHKLLESVLSDLSNKKGSNDLRIEFFLPNNLFRRNFEQEVVKWKYGREAVLGLRYPVVIRPLERFLFPPAVDECKERWKVIRNIGQHSDKEHIEWITEDSHEYKFKQMWETLCPRYVVCLCMTLSSLLSRPTERDARMDKVLNSIVESGIPIALWSKHSGQQM